MDSLRNVLNDASQSCDVILTSGGVSMGEYDFVRKIMEEEGEIKFWRVKLRPGSPHYLDCGITYHYSAYQETQ